MKGVAAMIGEAFYETATTSRGSSETTFENTLFMVYVYYFFARATILRLVRDV